MRTKIRIQSTSAIFVWRALRNFAMAAFEENVEEIVVTTTERRMATESGEDETGDETGGPGDETGDKTASTAGDERASGDRWGNVTNEGELELMTTRWKHLKGSV